MAGSNWERVLAAEWLAVMSIETFDALSGAGSGKFKLPKPDRYFATMIVFLFLAAAAMFGERPGKLAAGIGGVAALAILVTPGVGQTGTSPVIGALNYFDQLLGGKKTTEATVLTAGTQGTQYPAGAPVINPVTGLDQYGNPVSVLA